eukprot:sb/3474513/
MALSLDMFGLTLVFVLAVLSETVSFCSGIDGSEYIDYDDQSTWPELCLTGQLQSPIDLPDDMYSMKEPASINTPSAASDTSVMVANDDDHAIKVAYYPGEANNTFTQPIRPCYLGHVTGYQPISDQFLERPNTRVS